MKKERIAILLAICATLFPGSVSAGQTADDGMNMYQNSDFIEKEQPELTEETREMISLYQREPNEANYLSLRELVIENYSAVLDRKETKLAELRAETAGKPGGEEIVAEMEQLVQEMYVTYWDRINSSMLRFTDPRLLKWKTSEAAQYAYIPVMGAGESIYIKRTPVTNEEYAAYVEATGAQAPSNWTDGAFPAGEEEYPVNFVSFEDAQAYCEWLTASDGFHLYRLPSESEWELAAGHMPKDADFNCGVNDGRTPVEQYAGVTRGAHGAVDFWGNVWEWTSTARSQSDGVTILGVKGGSWASERTDCRTEYRGEGRDASCGYEDVGFRVIMVQNGQEPAQNVETATLAAPTASAAASSDAIVLSWQPVEGAVEYQIYEYAQETGLLKMLERTGETSVAMEHLQPNTTYGYIVQPISYTSICDNVSPEYVVTATTLPGDASAEAAAFMTLDEYDGMSYWLYTPANAEEGMPLIVYLHGVNGKADDPEQLLDTDDFANWLCDGQLGDIPAYVLIPQLSSEQKDWIATADTVVELICETAEVYAVDPENISLTGFSMGGAGTWFIGASHPELFARIAPLSGGVKVTEKMLANLSTMSIRAFVATDDTVVSPQSTWECASLLTERGADIRVTEYEGATHTDMPTRVYLEGDLLQWLTSGQ